MFKVLKKIGLVKTDDVAQKPENGDVTAKSFGGMGREKLRYEILKHKGMGKAPVPTAAGLALKQKQEIEKSTAKITNTSDSPATNYGSDSFGFNGSIGITSSSLHSVSTSHIEAVIPNLNDSHADSNFQKLFEEPESQENSIDLPSLSSYASMTFDLETNVDIPSDTEISSIENSESLDFPGYNDVTIGNKNNEDTLDFVPSGSKSGLTIQKSSERTTNSNTQSSGKSTLSPKFDDSLKAPGLNFQMDEAPSFAQSNTVDSSFNLDIKPMSFTSNESSNSTLEDTPSLSFDIPAELPNISLKSKTSSPVPKQQPKMTLTPTPSIDDSELTGKDLEFAQELATVYSEGGLDYVITTLRNHLSQNNGTVPQRFWYMLMDCYQVVQNKAEFEKVAIAFAYLFSTSPPSWFESDELVKKTVMSGKNIMILEPHFKSVHTDKFKTFLLAAKEEKFCRINVSPCKFELSELVAIEKLYELFKNLRKHKVLSVLMGDNNLINFCKTYINPNLSNKILKDDFLAREDLFWLIYLEILQWKGLEKEFEDLALEFAIKFEISPPGWETSGVMSLDKISKLDPSMDDEEPQIEKSLNSHNIDVLLNMINNGFQNSNKAEIDLSNVETIDFAAAGSISYQIQELWSEPLNTQKRVIFKYPNEMILTLLEMVGVTEFVDIIYRKR